MNMVIVDSLAGVPCRDFSGNHALWVICNLSIHTPATILGFATEGVVTTMSGQLRLVLIKNRLLAAKRAHFQLFRTLNDHLICDSSVLFGFVCTGIFRVRKRQECGGVHFTCTRYVLNEHGYLVRLLCSSSLFPRHLPRRCAASRKSSSSALFPLSVEGYLFSRPECRLEAICRNARCLLANPR